MKLNQIIQIHINASGPVSFASIVRYAKLQWSETVEEFHVASTLTAMIRSGHVDLYDDGTSFNPGPNAHINL